MRGIGESVRNLTAEANGTIILYARWHEEVYGISYELNGGTASNFESYSVSSGEITLENPTKLGYTFVGWSSTGLVGNDNLTVTIPTGSTGDREYTAHWQANSYTVIFNANGGDELAESEITVVYDAVYGELPIPTRTGYEFTGWYTSPTGGVEIVVNSKVETADDHTLYAQWNLATYTVTYDGIEGSDFDPDTAPSSYDVENKFGGHPYLPSPTKDGYTFEKWISSIEAVTIGWDDNNNRYEIKLPEGVAGDLTITATWKRSDILLLAPDGNQLGTLGEGDELSSTISYEENGTPVSQVVAYWVAYNGGGIHYCNGTTLEEIKENVTALQAVLMAQDTPMEIKDASQLFEIVSNGWLDGHYKLVSDVTLDSTWQGIGTDTSKTTAFTGTFDGNGYTITYGDAQAPVNHPLFRYIHGATIQNLTVTGHLTSSDYDVGGIVGYARSTDTPCEIINCTVTGDTRISVSRSSGELCVGGIAGYVSGTDVP